MPIVMGMAHTVRIVAAIACLLVVLGFTTFATEEIRHGSESQQAKLTEVVGGPAPTPRLEREREREHGVAREAVDDAGDVLLAPFTGVVESKNLWVQHGVPAVLGLLAYGLGLSLLANWLPKPKARGGDWRVA
jgi:hypothetical protein